MPLVLARHKIKQLVHGHLPGSSFPEAMLNVTKELSPEGSGLGTVLAARVDTPAIVLEEIVPDLASILSAPLELPSAFLESCHGVILSLLALVVLNPLIQVEDIEQDAAVGPHDWDLVVSQPLAYRVVRDAEVHSSLRNVEQPWAGVRWTNFSYTSGNLVDLLVGQS